MLVNLSIQDFLSKTAGNEPVPGGGSVSALCGALSAALGQMVTNLTIGRKKYAEQEENMKNLNEVFQSALSEFTIDIDADSNAYNAVFSAFKLPKETEEEKRLRSEKIQAATKMAIEVPMGVAKKAYALMEPISQVARFGNQNAVTDACVAMMCARTAVLGALLNVKINLSTLQDTDYAEKIKNECNTLEKETIQKEQELLAWIKTIL